MEDYQITPSQLTITQCVREQTATANSVRETTMSAELQRLRAIADVRHILKTDGLFSTHDMASRNDETRLDQLVKNARREREDMSDDNSDDDFQPKPKRAYLKPTFTLPPHNSQSSIHETPPKSKHDYSKGETKVPKRHSNDQRKRRSDRIVSPPSAHKRERVVSNEEIVTNYNNLLTKYKRIKRDNRHLKDVLRMTTKELHLYRASMSAIREYAVKPSKHQIKNVPLSEDEE